GGPDRVSGRRRFSLAWLGLVPFLAYAALFLFIPAGEVLLGAFKSADGSWSFSTIDDVLQPQYRHAYWVTIKVSLITAAAGGLLGFLIAYAAVRDGKPRRVPPWVTAVFRVAPDLPGVPPPVPLLPGPRPRG